MSRTCSSDANLALNKQITDEISIFCTNGRGSSECNLDKVRTEFDTVHAYPVDDYVKDCGEYVLIKFGYKTQIGMKLKQGA